MATESNTSPFPGMDPYLEAHWGDVHTSLVTYARDQIQAQLPAGLRARVEEYLSVEVETQKMRAVIPDVRITERPDDLRQESGGLATEVDVVTEPTLVAMPHKEPLTLRSIRIYDTQSGHRVVTAIEFLSPANKCSREGRSQYRRKQRELRKGGVNLVEIDLIRGGRHVLAVPRTNLPPQLRDPHLVCVVRASDPNWAEIYRFGLRQHLPKIKIPLRPTDADARLDLQALIQQAYIAGGYGADIDYSRPPEPPLRGKDAEWAEALLRERVSGTREPQK